MTPRPVRHPPAMHVRDLLKSDAQNTAGSPPPEELREALERVLRLATSATGLEWAGILLPSTPSPRAGDALPVDWQLSVVHANSESPEDGPDKTALSTLAARVCAHGDGAVLIDDLFGRPDGSSQANGEAPARKEPAREGQPGTGRAGQPSAPALAAIPLRGDVGPEPVHARRNGGTARSGGKRFDAMPGPWGVLILMSAESRRPLRETLTDLDGLASSPSTTPNRDEIRRTLRDAARLAATAVRGHADAIANVRYRRFVAESEQGIYRMEMHPPVSIDMPIEDQVDLFLDASRVEECNDALARMYGTDDRSQIIGKTLGDLHADEAEANRSAQRAFIEEGYRINNVVTQEPDRDGNLCYFSNTAFSIIIDGAVHRVWGIQQDITAIKETEAALHHSERLLASTLDTYPYATAIFDPDLRYLYANELAAESSHEDVDGMIGKRPETLYPSGIWEPLLPFLKRCRDQARFVQKMVTVERDGTERIIIASFVPLLNEQDRLESIIASTRDVTEERRAKENLRQSEQRLSLHVEHSPLAFVEWDLDGRIVKWNPAAEQIFGYSAREARGLHVADLSPVADRDETLSIWQEVTSDRKTVSQLRRRNLTKAGRLILCEWSMTPLVDHTGDAIGVAATAQDVTQEVQAREALQQERDLLRGVADTSAAGIIVADPNGNVSFANTRAETLLQSRRSVLSENFLEARFWAARDANGTMFSAEDLPFQRVLRTGDPVFDVEMVLDRPGQDVILSINAAPIHDDEGNVVQIVIVMEDITDRMARQLRIREHNEILARLAKMQVDMRDDVDGILRFTAEAAQDAFGTDRVSIWRRDEKTDDFVCVEVAGPGQSDDIGMRIGKPAYKKYLRAIQDRRAVCSEDVHRDERLRKLTAYNQERDIGSTLDAPVRIGGELVGLVSAEHIGERRSWSADLKNFAGSVADVVAQTFIVLEQDRSRAALQRSEQRWKALVEHHPGGVLISIDGRAVYANAAALNILGADSVDDLPSKQLLTIVDEEYREQYKERLRTVADDRQTTSPWEHDIIGLDGVHRTIVTQSVPITYREQAAAQTVVRDVTERRRREEQLRKAKEDAQQMNRLKTTFLANMSHEIRTPLTSIIGFAEILETEAPEPTDDIATIIGESSQRLLRTLNSVLDLSKLEAGAVQLTPEHIDVAERTNASTRIFNSRANESSIDLSTRFPEEPAYANLDESALDRVLDNLIGNALKFTPEGGEVHVAVDVNENTVTITVDDTGIGIPDAFRESIFEPFLQASDDRDDKHAGTGLGLAITHRLVDMMDGQITVASTVGEGTTFSVTFPRARPPECSEGQQ